MLFPRVKGNPTRPPRPDMPLSELLVMIVQETPITLELLLLLFIAHQKWKVSPYC